MELSDFTVQVLKNFAGINSNIVISPGNVIQTISEAKNILAKAEVPESFPNQFGIYDLNEFLNVLNLVDKPNITFTEQFVNVGDSTGRSKIKYFFSDPEMLTSPTRDVKMPEVDVKFTLDNDTLNKVKRAAAALGHSEVHVNGNKNSVVLNVSSKDNSTANTFSIDIDGQSNVDNYNLIFNIANLKILQGTYNVAVSSKLISEFSNNENPLKYWIALEKNSTYGV